MKLNVTIPIGVGAPGTPIPKYLRKGIECLKKQTQPVEIVVVSDNNVSDEVKKILEEQDVHVKWYEPHCYFRPGGIWRKIVDSWKSTSCEYVSFLHYDDLWSYNKAEFQTNLIESENLLGCWCESYIIDSQSVVRSDNKGHE